MTFERPVTMRSELPHRWLVLALASLLLMGAYYCFDIPAALYSHFASAFSSEMTAASYAMLHNVLYTVYALPNLALPLFAGYLVDAFGAHAVIAVLCATLAAGQALLSAGVLLKSVTLLVVGRVLFGVGGESVVVAQSAVVTEWFRGGELAFALGLTLSVSRMGSVLNDWVSPRLAASASLSVALWVGVGICVVSLACSLALFPLERVARRLLAARGRAADARGAPHGGDEEDAQASHPGERSSLLGHGGPPPGAGVAADAAADLEDADLLAPSAPFAGAEAAEAGGSVNAPAHPGAAGARRSRRCTALLDALRFDARLWLLALSMVCVYGVIIPFNTIASPMLVEMFICHGACCEDSGQECPALEAAERTAGAFMSVPYLVGGLSAPLLGWLIDRYGGRALIATLSPLLLVVVHCMILLVQGDVYGVLLPLVLQGCAYGAFAAAIWPSVPLIVRAERVGAAFGLLTVLMNLALALLPLAIGALRGWRGDYVLVEALFVGLSVVGVCGGVALQLLDARRGGVLNAPTSRSDAAPDRAGLKRSPADADSDGDRDSDGDSAGSADDEYADGGDGPAAGRGATPQGAGETRCRRH